MKVKGVFVALQHFPDRLLSGAVSPIQIAEKSNLVQLYIDYFLSNTLFPSIARAMSDPRISVALPPQNAEITRDSLTAA